MANKKINQLVSKTSILSTDLFGIGDATTGQLFKKTIAELQAAIGGAVISVNGLVGTVVLDTDDIQELATPTNKWFTDARARGAISLTVTGNSGASTYSSGTGVLNVPTYTLAGLGGITATFLSGGTGISYNSTTGVISYSGTVYTDASIRALFSGGTGITYNSTTGAITYSGTVYTDSSIRALISLTTTGNSGASTYNNTTGVINVPNYTLAGLGGISLTSLSGGTGITYNNTTGQISYSGTVYTDSSIRGLISATSPISYNSTTGVISLTSGNLTEATSSVLTITGGTGAVLGSGTSIQVKQASSTVSGFLSSTDWNTFNGKASALSGTTNYVAKFTSSTGIGNSQIFDNGTNIGIGTTSPGSTLDVNGNFRIGSGTVSAPGISFRSSTNSGFYLTDDGFGALINIGIGATNIATFKYNGNVGIGTITPGAKLELYGNYVNQKWNDGTRTGVIALNSDGADPQFRFEASNNFVFVTGATERMRITSAGNVGIGTSAPAYSFEVKRTGTDSTIWGYNIAQIADGTTNATGFRVGTSTSISGLTNLVAATNNDASQFAFWTYNGSAWGERGRITAGGNWLLGTTSDNGERLYVSGAIRATGTITANSDLTLKKNLLKIENALEKVEQINGYTYEFKADDSKRHAGVIAQEIQTVLPEIVNKGNDGILGVEYGNISALLIEAIKEQNIKIKNLETLLASK
jgi:hypothetical protein